MARVCWDSTWPECGVRPSKVCSLAMDPVHQSGPWGRPCGAQLGPEASSLGSVWARGGGWKG